MVVEFLLCTLALGLAVAVRPWRALGAEGPPLPWLAWWAILPLLWGADRYANSAVLQPLSGACLLVMMSGWALAVPAFVAAAVITGLLGGLDLAESLHRLFWLGILPGTVALGIGALVRRLLPHHLFIYILGRGFFGTLLTGVLVGGALVLVQGASGGLSSGDLMVGRWLTAFGDAIVTGMLVSIFVAFRPQYLATYTDRIYLPKD